MKHIRRKFLNEKPLKRKENEAPLHEALISKGFTTEMMNNAKISNDSIPYFLTDDAIYTGFQVKINGKKRIIPEPDSILVYYSTAYFNYKALDDAKNKVIEKTQQTIGGEPAIDDLYEYFGLVSCVIIFLFMSVEGSMNRCIPDDYTYKNEMAKKTETYSKGQVERYLSFENKLKVINEITHKNFHQSFGIKYQHIINLKKFRDDIKEKRKAYKTDTRRKAGSPCQRPWPDAAGCVSTLEQKEALDKEILEKIAAVLKVPADAIKNFSEDAAINIISSTLHDNAGSIFNSPSFNPIDKVVELYERMLRDKDIMIEKLEELLKK